MGGPTYDEALSAVRARLSARGAAHSERAGETAARIAVVYGVEAERARLAGLLHDWDRDRPRDELLGAAREAGVAVTASDVAVPKLLHSKTGAADLAKRFPGIPPEVLSAVSKHTVGAAQMSDLDMIVFMADMIEPERTYDGVESLRGAVGVVPLAELFALGYQQSVLFLVRKRKYVHPDTVDVWNRYVAGGPR